MKIEQHWKRLTLGIFALILVGFFSGCAASGAASDATADAGAAGGSGKKGRKAKKEEIYSPVGAWDYTVETPDGGGSGVMRVTGEPGIFEVVLETGQFGDLRVYDLDMTGQSMRGKIDVSGVTAEIEGDFDDDDFIGYLIVGENTFPMEATRSSKD